MGFKDRFVGFSYKYFYRLGKPVLKLYYNLPIQLRMAGMTIYYEAYASIVGFIFLITIIGIVALFVTLFFMGILTPKMILMLGIAFFPLPIIILALFGLVIPSGKASSVGTQLDKEYPYVLAYMETMLSGAPNLVFVMEKIADLEGLFKEFPKKVKKVLIYIRGFGKDPLESISRVTDEIPSSKVRDFFSGIVATTKTGGDVYDYVTKKGQVAFQELLSIIRISADRLSTILESFLGISLLLLITLTALFLVNMSIGEISVGGFGAGTMIFTLGFFLPFLSFAIGLMAHSFQYTEPIYEKRALIVFFGISFPLILFLMVTGMAYQRLNPPLDLFGRFVAWYIEVTRTDPSFFNGAVAAFAFLFATLPALITEVITTSKWSGYMLGMSQFLRDLSEIRKTGLPPEKSIVELSSREYGPLTEVLRRIALNMELGMSLRKAVELASKKIPLWRIRMFLHMLVDSIEAGGGTPHIFDKLANYSETVINLEKEYKGMLKSLVFVPYMGAIIMLLTVGLMISFSASLTTNVIAYQDAVAMILPLLVLNIYIIGYVIGKVMSGRIANGTVHSTALMAVTIIVLALMRFAAGAVGGITIE